MTTGTRRPRVAAIFNGGTISMVVDPVAGGAVPALDGAAILARTPGLETIAEVIAVDRGLKPASHFTTEDLLDLAATVRRLADDPSIDGVVVIQGTDTIEETSFLLDLLVAGPTPIVVTGAMRNATEPDYDGPGNLRDAVRCAASPELAGIGTVVVLGATIEPADDVTKTHTTALDTFRSLNFGRLGRIEGERVVLERPRGPRRPILRTTTLALPIPIVVATVAMDARIIDAAVGLGPAGLVVAATGSGNTSPELLDAGRRAIESGVPLVLASRAASGAAGVGYAFPGGGATWVRAGAMLAGTLVPSKARIALAVGLGAGLGGADLAAFLAGPAPSPAGSERPGGVR
jgi:L-asparaginase